MRITLLEYTQPINITGTSPAAMVTEKQDLLRGGLIYRIRIRYGYCREYVNIPVIAACSNQQNWSIRNHEIIKSCDILYSIPTLRWKAGVSATDLLSMSKQRTEPRALALDYISRITFQHLVIPTASGMEQEPTGGPPRLQHYPLTLFGCSFTRRLEPL